MSIEKRIDKLEKRTGGREQLIITVRYDEVDTEPTEPTEAQKKAAIADYKAKHPDWKEGDFILLEWQDGQFQEP